MALNLFYRPKLEELTLKKFSKLKTYDYRKSNQTEEQLIINEKRRRHQAYMKMDYFLTGSTYFDFFSSDTFKIVKYSKYFAEVSAKENVNSDCLLLPIVNSQLEIAEILKEHNFSKRTVSRLLSQVTPKRKTTPEMERNYARYNLVKKLPFSFGFNRSLLKKLLSKKKISYSTEMYNFFENVAENSLTRFKTPVITPEILFISMMEARTKNMGRVIRKILQTDANWYLLRYKLIKRIHAQEVSIRTEVELNQQYFAYLLKINLSEIQFDRLIESGLLSLGVEVFRSNIITEVLALNLFDTLEVDIRRSIKATSKRKYTRK